jgi:hypothetical protein
MIHRRHRIHRIHRIKTRGWTQVMMMPEEIIKWLITDIHELTWRQDPHFESGQEGQADLVAKRKLKECTAKIAWKEGGIGILMCGKST